MLKFPCPVLILRICYFSKNSGYETKRYSNKNVSFSVGSRIHSTRRRFNLPIRKERYHLCTHILLCKSKTHFFSQASKHTKAKWNSLLLLLQVWPPPMPSLPLLSWERLPWMSPSLLPPWIWNTRSLLSEEDLLEHVPPRSLPKKRELTLSCSSVSLITPSHVEVPSHFVWLENSTFPKLSSIVR